MRTFLVLICLLFCLNSYSQKKDSINKKLQYIQTNLDYCHSEFTYGTSLVTSGILIAAGGWCVYTFLEKPPYIAYGTRKPRIGPTMMGIGGCISLAGYIFQIDSHKFVKRASFGMSENGLSLKFNIK